MTVIPFKYLDRGLEGMALNGCVEVNSSECLDNDKSGSNSIALLRALYSNIGDLAIYKGTMNVFSQLNIEPSYIFDPEPTFPEDYLQNYNLNLIYTFPSLIEQEIQRNGRTSIGYIRPTLHLPYELLQLNKLKKDIGFLYCLGGARFGAKFEPHVIGEIYNTCYKRKLLDAKLIIGGISIAKSGNNRMFKRIYQKFLNQVTHLFVRDNISYHNLSGYNIPPENYSLICDFAFWLNPLESQRSAKIMTILDDYSRGFPLIGIAPGMDIKSLKLEYLISWCHLIRTLHNSGYDIVLIPTSHNPRCLTPPHDKDDYGFCHLINSELDLDLPIIQTSLLEPEEIIEFMKKFDCVISARMHGAIFSTIANVPTIHIYNEQKGLGLFNTFFNNSVCLYSLEQFLDYNNTHLDLICDLERLLDFKCPYSEIISNMKDSSLREIKDVFSNIELIN